MKEGVSSNDLHRWDLTVTCIIIIIIIKIIIIIIVIIIIIIIMPLFDEGG